ncbi:MAG: hypothetical protein AMXMBFR13_17840 [Phycisphaerae bacterium]
MPLWTTTTAFLVAGALTSIVIAQEAPSNPEHKQGHRHAGRSHDAKPVTSQPAATSTQRFCPVSGKPVDQSIYTDYEKQRIYFCSEECIAQFRQSPRKYLAAVYRQVYPQRIQVRCPVTDNPIDSSVFADHANHRVFFCCPSCVHKFEAAPKKYLARMGEISTEQVHCPVSGHLIDPQVRSDEDVKFNGRSIHYCCEGCVDKLGRDPLRYVDRLRPQAGLLAYGRTAEDDLLISLPEGDIRRRADTTTHVHDDIRYALSDLSIVETFSASFGKYARLIRDTTIEVSSDSDTLLSCSVHPTIIRYQAGNCPLCRKTLEPIKRGG